MPKLLHSLVVYLAAFLSLFTAHAEGKPTDLPFAMDAKGWSVKLQLSSGNILWFEGPSGESIHLRIDDTIQSEAQILKKLEIGAKQMLLIMNERENGSAELFEITPIEGNHFTGAVALVILTLSDLSQCLANFIVSDGRQFVEGSFSGKPDQWPQAATALSSLHRVNWNADGPVEILSEKLGPKDEKAVLYARTAPDGTVYYHLSLVDADIASLDITGNVAVLNEADVTFDWDELKLLVTLPEGARVIRRERVVGRRIIQYLGEEASAKTDKVPAVQTLTLNTPDGWAFKFDGSGNGRYVISKEEDGLLMFSLTTKIVSSESMARLMLESFATTFPDTLKNQDEIEFTISEPERLEFFGPTLHGEAVAFQLEQSGSDDSNFVVNFYLTDGSEFYSGQFTGSISNWAIAKEVLTSAKPLPPAGG